VPQTIYFDYNATTPLDPQIRATMLPFFDDVWGNASSIHHVGRQARSLLDDFRDRTSRVFKCKPSEIIFTSGGTEANNLAIFGVARLLRFKGRHLITSSIEHHAVLHCFQYLAKEEGFELSVLPADREGRVSVDSLRLALRPDTILVSVMAANNEVGTIQPIADLGACCRDNGVLFHTDAAQWFGKEPFSEIHQFNADLVSLCAHKIHGPKGVGILYIRSPLLPHSILLGGGQEYERRAGTENLAAIAGMVAAVERFVVEPVFPSDRMNALSEKLASTISTIQGTTLLSPKISCLKNTVSFLVNRTDSFALLAGLDVEGVCASAGAACSAGSLEPSHVVSAMGFSPSLARSLIRFSLGRENSLQEVDHVCSLLPYIILRSQAS